LNFKADQLKGVVIDFLSGRKSIPKAPGSPEILNNIGCVKRPEDRVLDVASVCTSERIMVAKY